MNPLYLIGIPLALIALMVRQANAPGNEPTSYWSKRTPQWKGAAPILSMNLPRPGLVADTSRKWSPVFKIPVEWLRSQAYAESRNVTTAVNKTTGAMGVLQILPDTAKWLVTSLRKSSFAANELVKETLNKAVDLADLLNPDVNIMLAAYYLTILRKKFGGDHDIVAAAYNAGPNKIAYYVDNQLPLPERSRIYLAMVKDGKRRGYT
jgi:soluble lytic murein transglycosylase-like protein